MKTYLYFIFFFVFSFQLSAQEKNKSVYVNPFIGTGGHGHTFPGATVPFGMVQLSPDTRIDGSWDGCSGYHYSDSIIYGFSHTHLSGTGCSDYGDIAILPFAEYKNQDLANVTQFNYKNYASTFSHKNEIASAGYYSVLLDNKIRAELTSTTRVGFHRYTFPENQESRIVVQLDHRDKTIQSDLKLVDNKTIEGYRRSEAWAKDQYIYFVIEFSESLIDEDVKFEILSDKQLNKTYFHRFSFGKLNGKPLLIKVGISNVSIEGARKNLNAELPGWDFEKTKKAAEALWNKELGKIEVSTSDKDKLNIFYTALYHAMIQPNVAMDVDSIYRGRDNKIHKAEGFTYYSVFSLWDTFRAAHPLYTIIDRKRTLDFYKTFLAQYIDGGRLPMWELASNETDCMIAYHSVSVIADAANKGIIDFDPKLKFNMNLAFDAMKHSATLDHLGLKAFKQSGVITMDDESESVSKTLEYAYDDWCIAQIAQQLSKTEEYTNFIKRSQSWKNIFDIETGFMRPKKNGGWLTPFDPREVNNNFTEANSWQYTFFVPQDVYGLVEMLGGANKFDKKLDELFTSNSKTTGRDQADITGLVGQYAQGNEPSHHIAYLYDYIGKPWKTQERIHQLLTDFYKNSPDGLIGNEDCGQMSAWYVLSSMGFYQVCPGNPSFSVGVPLFKNVKINLENGKTFTVNTSNFSEKNKFIKSTSINSKKVVESRFSYADIYYKGKGKEYANSELNFLMTEAPDTIPNPNLFISDASYFHNYENGIYDNEIAIVPVIKADSKVFNDSLKIELFSSEKKSKIYYILDSVGYINSYNLYNNKLRQYFKPFYISKNVTISAFCIKEITPSNKKFSDVTTSHFFKRPNSWKIQINSKYNPQYTAGGDDGIIDGIYGDENWRKGEWQGYQGQDFEAIIDLGKEQNVSTFSAEFLQDSRSWILMPKKVEFYTSTDNKQFTLIATIDNSIKPDDNTSQVKKFKATLSKSIISRFVKVKAINFGQLPEWHQGAGGEAFIFIDEIFID